MNVFRNMSVSVNLNVSLDRILRIQKDLRGGTDFKMESIACVVIPELTMI